MGEFDGQRAVVMGLGRFGGGAGAAAWLASQGADVLVTDMANADKLGPALESLKPHLDSGALTLRLGEHNVSDFTGADLVVVNPGVPRPWDNRFVRAARAAGGRVTTEIGLVVERLPERMRGREHVIGVTGTAGKSTTTAMIECGLRACGADVIVGGNIGGSLLGSLDQIGEKTRVVLELSSAMLWWLGGAGGQDGAQTGWSPGIAVVTSFAANHDDWHGSQEHYQECKRLLLANQREADVAVLGPGVSSWEIQRGVTRCSPSTVRSSLSTPGAHNRLNAGLARAACLSSWGERDTDAMDRGIAAFPGLPHRCRLVHTSANGIRFYDDSKCTVPGGVSLAASGVGEAVGGMPRVHLIAGGSDKGLDLSPIGRLGPSVGGLYLIGETARSIEAHAGGTATMSGTLENALGEIHAKAAAGDAVLLSPGCASFGQFVNYEHRGQEFARLARAVWADAD
ncbi:MAG: UDP-N-acetylmuramoylalanine--D-glutamate ligase [Phycisphaerales bacterium]